MKKLKNVRDLQVFAESANFPEMVKFAESKNHSRSINHENGKEFGVRDFVQHFFFRVSGRVHSTHFVRPLRLGRSAAQIRIS